MELVQCMNGEYRKNLVCTIVWEGEEVLERVKKPLHMKGGGGVFVFLKNSVGFNGFVVSSMLMPSDESRRNANPNYTVKP